MGIDKKERFSAFSHFAGAVGAFFGLILLIIMCKGQVDLMLACFVYGLCVMFLFTSSGIYHIKKKSDDEVSFWRKLDHLAIFFMIAGTYTVTSYIYMPGYWKLGIILAQWTLVLLGVFFKFFWLKSPRFFSTMIYLLMGWMALLPIKELFVSMGRIEFLLLFLGGVAFSVGAFVYIFKKPNFWPNRIGFHGLFHVFILLGGLLHFIMVVIAINKCTNFF